MEKIDYDTRIHLSKLLDPCKIGCDWQALADKLGLKKMMEGQIGEHSPTRLLLTYFEVGFPVLQIRRDNRDNLGIISHISP